MEVTVTEPADFFLLRINKCWATQSSQPNATEGLHHTLLQNGSEQLSRSTACVSFVPNCALLILTSGFSLYNQVRERPNGLLCQRE